MVQDVFRMEPTEWSEALPIVDFVRYNTPISGLGLTPRDIDRGWSLATPLERELRPFEGVQYDAVSDVARKQLSLYRELRTRIVGRMAEESQKRADLVNRFRRSRTLQVGQR
eukprot:6347734-Lingulodinium_polyedra.AAC.1